MRRFAGILAVLLAFPLAFPLAARAQKVVLDADGDRVLIGEILPAAPNSDPALKLQLHLEQGGRRLTSALDGRVLSFARLLPGGRFLGVTPEGRLFSAKLKDGSDEKTIDERVQGAVSASPDGRHLAYCKADGEDRIEVFRADDGRPSRVTTEMQPTWSPAVSPDGRTVVFVSARTGVPALWQVRAAGPARQLTNVGVVSRPGVTPVLSPFPDALTAPLVAKDRIVFEARGAVHLLDGNGKPLRILEGAVSPTWVKSGRTLRIFRAGSSVGETLDLTRLTGLTGLTGVAK